MDERLSLTDCSCGAPIFTALFEGVGQPMTFDAEPVEHGTYEIVAWGINGNIQVWMGQHTDPSEARYRAHDCSQEAR